MSDLADKAPAERSVARQLAALERRPNLRPGRADLPLTVYTPDLPLRDPRRLARDMLRDLAASRELAWRLFLRDTRAQYRNSVLGYAWVFIPPLVASLPFIYLNAQC